MHDAEWSFSTKIEVFTYLWSTKSADQEFGASQILIGYPHRAGIDIDIYI